MKKSITLMVVVSALCSAVAQEQTNFDFLNPEFFDSPSSPQTKAIPTFVILPVDVVQDSVMRIWSSDHRMAVRWVYTEAGAKKALAFWEAHREQTVRTVVGDCQFIGQVAPASALPPGVASYSEWKEGWLKHRTDKIFGVSEDDAKTIIAGLKGQ
ncbi:MAG TPA: hypothetical protein VGJ73_08110 [Verrucomicrobiae bacterium]